MLNEVLLGLLVTVPGPATGAKESLGQFLRLVPPRSVEVLERENLITKLCPAALGAEKLKSCREEKLKPMSWELRVFSEPKDSAATLEKIIVTATPGVGLVARYRTKDGKLIEMKPDQFDADFGYGPWFDFTVKAVSGDWVQLPKRPFSKPVWVHPKADWKLPATSDLLVSLELGTVLKMEGLGHFVVTRIDKGKVSLREETPADMACGEEVKPVSKPTRTLPIESFFDADGHHKVSTAYTRGC